MIAAVIIEVGAESPIGRTALLFRKVIETLFQQHVQALVEAILGFATEGGTFVQALVVFNQGGRAIVSVQKWDIMVIHFFLCS